MGVNVLYESDNFIIVNKPYDMYINSDDKEEKNTVTFYIGSLNSHLRSSMNPLHFIHRLDYATSGVLCIAKKKSAAAEAGKLFEKRLTKKYYLAVVRGHITFDLADIDYPVGIDRKPQCEHRMRALTNMDEPCLHPRDSHTRMLLLETGYYGEDPISVVLLKPFTGRRHQLRVHCRAINHTILGDYTYSGKLDREPHRMYLHATRLVVPLKKEPLDIQTAEPFFSDEEFTRKWKPLQKFYDYKSKDDFVSICNTMDGNTPGLKCQTFALVI
ncbi:RNA pseudouridylate synthase domain-containing protein 1-like [Aricia agestis]|uniref:RNA pseudouridylate synthase domain-containing protein 1-like n=1 Tax=Aricia agestis TaxID=91739 RepID=UPI001C20501D|nr:RNA pseudouridylate synthase domain-containing protein 1-like [Aricia agestis]